MKRIRNLILRCLFCVALLLIPWGDVAGAEDLVCGIAHGFAPYQFRAKGRATGYDADVIRLVFERMGRRYRFYQDDWDTVLNDLRYGNVDVVTGMEINELRMKYFDFTAAYYHRKIVLFIRADSTGIQSVEDLYGRVVTGDRHSFIEEYWRKRGIWRNIRIMQTGSKEKSMQLLHKGKVAASIMPRAVGFYHAGKLGLKVRVLSDPDPGSPVAIAVKKGNRELLKSMDRELKRLISEGEIERLYKRWFGTGEVFSEPVAPVSPVRPGPP